MKTRIIVLFLLALINSALLLSQLRLPCCDHCLVQNGYYYGKTYTLTGECYCTYPDVHFVGYTYDCYTAGGLTCEQIECYETIYCTTGE